MTQTAGMVAVNNTHLYYERAGSGHSLVLLHGFTLNTQMWDDQFALFARHYQTIRYDMRGSGRSSLPTEEPFTAVDDLRVLLDVLGVHRTFVLGFSRGGSVAIDFALAYPERTSALVLVDPTLCGWPWSDAFSESMHELERTARTLGVKVAQQQWLAHPLFLPAREQPEVAGHLAHMVANYTGWSWLYPSPEREFDLPEVRPLERINVPTLLIIGERDIEEFQAIANHIVCTVSHLTKLIVSNVGHVTNMEAPEVFNQAVLRFLKNMKHHLE